MRQVPISAFEIAERYRPGSYELRADRAADGRGREHFRCQHECRDLRSSLAPIDTLIIAGGEGTRAAAIEPRIVKFVGCLRRRGATRRQRVLGRLHPGRHRLARWARRPPRTGRAAAISRGRFPRVKLDADRIFIKVRKVLELGRHHGGHRSVTGTHRRGSRRSGGAQGGATTRGLLPPAGWPVAILDAARARARRWTLRAAARSRAQQSARAVVRGRARGQGMHEPAQFRAAVPGRDGHESGACRHAPARRNRACPDRERRHVGAGDRAQLRLR